MTDQDQDVDTSYHGITKPSFEKDPWDHDYYDFVDTVDANLKFSGTLSNRPDSGNAPVDAWYEATDTNIIYRNDSDNGWIPIGFGTSSDSIPEAYFQKVGFQNDFDITVDGDELVISDDSVELIRIPKGDSTQFVQGIDAGSIEAPEDSFTQIINASSTSNASQGDLVGYTFSIDNQTGMAIVAESDGSGGVQNFVHQLKNGDLEVGHESGGDVNISGELTENSSL